MDNRDISSKNKEFWDELCGSQLAAYIGITDARPASLKKFDDWYFDFYPYLFYHIPFDDLKGRDVLEVGLGYGTVAQKLAESGANYHGLDIAAGPVNMAIHRLRQANLTGQATQGSILDPPFKRQSFDAIVAIGCLHHTGDLKLSIDCCWELLRPGGKLIFMVYYAYSYRRYKLALIPTLYYLLRESGGYRGVVGSSAIFERAAYDSDLKGGCAPHTDWISMKSIRSLCSRFNKFKGRIENIDQGLPFLWISRKKMLRTSWPQRMGLDLYVTAIK